MINKLKTFVSNYSQIMTVNMLVDLCSTFEIEPSQLLGEFIQNKSKCKVSSNSNKTEFKKQYIDTKEYFSCDAVADKYGVKKKTVWEWIRTKKLNAVKIGRQYFVRAEDMEEFENSRCTRQILLK
jgi:DNA binding domain, excisionase family